MKIDTIGLPGARAKEAGLLCIHSSAGPFGMPCAIEPQTQRKVREKACCLGECEKVKPPIHGYLEARAHPLWEPSPNLKHSNPFSMKKLPHHLTALL
jgi:hypothetical protein